MKSGVSLIVRSLGLCGLMAVFGTAAFAQSPVKVPLTGNVYGIGILNHSGTGRGIDGGGDTYASNLLGSSVSFAGSTFSFVAPGPGSAASSKVISLPTGKYKTLNFLGLGIAGAHLNQQFVVSYTDGTKKTFTQSLSNWNTPQHFQGEAIVKTTAYKLLADGTPHYGAYNVYGYTFVLDPTKTVHNLTLPANAEVVVLALDLTPAAASTPPPIAATPMLSPGAGNYTSAPKITITESTSGASVYVTLDGSTPTTASPKYVNPFSIAANSRTTVKAIAVAPGYTNSAVASDVYTVAGGTPPPVATATPKFNPGNGAYRPPLTVTLSDSTPGAVIYFTTDGTPPTKNSSIYPSTGIPIYSPTTINAFALAPGFTGSTVATGSYSLNLVTATTPIISPPAGLIATTTPITMTASPSDAAIHFLLTATGYTPTLGSPLYSAAAPPLLPPGATTTVTAIAFADLPSPMATSVYTSVYLPSEVEYPPSNPPATPPTTPPVPPLTYPEIFLFNNTANAAIADSCAYYTAIGAIPSGGSCALNPDGSFASGLTKQQWMQQIYDPLAALNPESHATFINVMDLNFSREHHAVIGNGASPDSAAYVCNFPGPDFFHDAVPPAFVNRNAGDQTAIDAAIANVSASNPVGALPCVVFDYVTTAGNSPYASTLNGGKRFMRFLAFSAAGGLLPQVDLDQRGLKSIPNACSACHGVPYGATAPAGQPNPAPGTEPHYIPFDLANMAFSSVAGLTEGDQQSMLRALNLIVLNGQGTSTSSPTVVTAPTTYQLGTTSSPIHDLIHGWYATYNSNGTVSDDLGSSTFQLYAPPYLVPPTPNSTLSAADLKELGVYVDVYAATCRSCHVANNVAASGFPPSKSGDVATVMELGNVCNPPANAPGVVVMPNTKVSFDRFWTSHFQGSRTYPSGFDSNFIDGPSLVADLLGGNVSCGLRTSYPPAQ